MKKIVVFSLLLLAASCTEIKVSEPTTNLEQSSAESLDQRDPALVAREQEQAAKKAFLDENRRLMTELHAVGVDVHDSERGIVISLPDVLFHFGSAELTSRADKIIKDIADVIQMTPNRRIAVEGHTDSVGTISYNYELSVARAEAVARKLAHNGISQEIMDVRGLGETDPIATNKDDRGRSENRRVEVIVQNRR